MRVTNNMIADGVTFNLQRALQRFIKTQTDVSSGRRINRASDDPIGTVRDLNFRRELKNIEQFQQNIGRGLNWAFTYDNTLSEVNTALNTVNEIAVAMADGVFDADQRSASATEVESIIQQILLLANGKLEGRQLFGGLRTRTTAFDRGANGVTYRGDQGQTQFEIESGSRATVNMVGSDVFLKQLSILGANSDLNVGVLGSTPLAELQNGTGIDQTVGTFTITDVTQGITSTIDVSGATTLNDVLTTINTQLTTDGISTVVAKLGAEKNNILMDTTYTGQIGVSTPLAALNNGQGVDLSPGSIRITDGAAVDFTVDLSAATSIGDVITTVNTQLALNGVINVTMGFNNGNTGLALVDTNVVPYGLTIEDTSAGSPTASQLGINGSFTNLLDGTALTPELRFIVAETTGSTAIDLGILKVFTSDYSGEDLDPILTPTSSISDLNLANGFGLGLIKMTQGERIATIDLGSSTLLTVQDALDAINNSGMSVTASINADRRGIQIVNNDVNRSFIIEDLSGGRTTKDLQIFGSSDVLGSLQVILNSLKRDDQEEVGLLIKNVGDSISQILDQRAISGARAKQLQSTQIRLDDASLSFTKLLSEVEDSDLTEVLTRLASQESTYQSALIASSKIIQPSLMDFLRI